MMTDVKHLILGTLLISFSSLQVAQADDALDRTIVPHAGTGCRDRNTNNW